MGGRQLVRFTLVEREERTKYTRTRRKRMTTQEGTGAMAPLFAPEASSSEHEDGDASTQLKQVVTTTAVASIPATQVTTTTTNAKALSEDFYNLNACTVVVTLQFYPVATGEEGQQRRVLLSIQNGAGNKDELPLLAIVTQDELGGPLPQALLDLWARLEADLPLRKQRQDERVAKAAVTRSSAVITGSKKMTAAKPASPPLPPTTTTPIEKEGLGMSGLFDATE
jgi:hypothetical protein